MFGYKFTMEHEVYGTVTVYSKDRPPCPSGQVMVPNNVAKKFNNNRGIRSVVCDGKLIIDTNVKVC